MRWSPWLSQSALIVLLGIVVWTPLPIASVLPRDVMVFQIAAGLALALATVSVLTARDAVDGLNRSSVAVFASLSAIAIYGYLQSRVWPAAIVEALAPSVHRLQQNAAALLEGYGAQVSSTLSIAAPETERAALIWFAVAACFGAAAILGAKRSRRRWLAGCLIGSGLFQVLYGGLMLGTGRIWGGDFAQEPPRLRGTFVNPDHMAVYLEMVLTVCFAWGMLLWSRRSRNEDDGRSILAFLPWGLWLLMFAGLAFSGSRGGLIAILLASTVQGLLWGRATGQRRIAFAGGAIGALGLVLVVVLGFQQGFGRLLGTSAFEVSGNARSIVYSTTLGLWTDFAATGTGLGTFQEAFTLAQPAGLRGFWAHAHNDYLELLLTTGIVGVLLFVPAIVVTARRLLRLLLEGRRREEQAAALAALGALTALALHSCFDFGLTTPANAATLAILCGAVTGIRLGEERDKKVATQRAAA